MQNLNPPICNSVHYEHEYEYIKFEQNDNQENASESKFSCGATKVSRNVSIGLVAITIVVAILCGAYLFRGAASKNEDAQIRDRRNFIKQMTIDAWVSYVNYSWEHRVLLPETKEGDGRGKFDGLTILEAMSTLWVMNLTREFEIGQMWIKHELNVVDTNHDYWVHELLNWYVGSLLSCFALTRDLTFVDKAKEIAESLKPAYNTFTGLPFKTIEMKNKSAFESSTYLSHASGYQLEYIFLANITGESQFKERVKTVRKYLNGKVKKLNGMYMDEIDVQTGMWVNRVCSLFVRQRDFYENLVLSYIQSGGLDEEAIKMYKQAIDAVDRNGLFAVSKWGSHYAREYYPDSKSYGQFMWYDSCYLGSMLALGARAMEDALKRNSTGHLASQVEIVRIERHWHLAKGLTETCHQAEIKTKTGLAPQVFYFDHDNDATNVNQDYKEYYLIGESARSYFVLWRLTRESKYREYAWHLAEAIFKHCRTECGGNSDIENVHQTPTKKLNIQREYFFAITLKFLYLTFCDDNVLPLDEWVFTREGQPIPIQRH